MIKYIIIGLFIPAMIVTLTIGIALIRPLEGVSRTTSYGYETIVVTVNNNNETVVALISRPINGYIKDYISSEVYKYYLTITPSYLYSTSIKAYIKDDKVLIIAVPSQPYYGFVVLKPSLGINFLKAINSVKIYESDTSSISNERIPLSIFSKYVDNVEIRIVRIITFEKYTQVRNILPYYAAQFSKYQGMYLTDIVYLAMGNTPAAPTAQSILQVSFERIAMFQTTIHYILGPGPQVILRDIILLSIIVGLLIYDYRRRPDEYYGLRKILRIFKKEEKS